MSTQSQGDLPVEVTFIYELAEAKREAVFAMPAFRRWVEKLATNFIAEHVYVERVVFFGSRHGFVLASAQAKALDGTAIPTTVFLRGDSVAVLPVLTDSAGRIWTLLLRQARVPVGAAAYEEIPAGMLDGGVFASKALDELREETGVDLGITEADLELLEQVHPSPGACDESIRIYAAHKLIDDETLARLSGAKGGNPDEHESITVEVVPLADLAFRATADMKARLAYYAWHASCGIKARPTEHRPQL